jgi:hypothetical protein
MQSTTHWQHPAGVPTTHDRWLVGLRLHTPQTTRTWHYYVIGDTTKAADAVTTAIKRAAAPTNPQRTRPHGSPISKSADCDTAPWARSPLTQALAWTTIPSLPWMTSTAHLTPLPRHHNREGEPRGCVIASVVFGPRDETGPPPCCGH